ncbi:MAG: O-antigen ligase family protein [Desulfocurvibacter africanus]
MFRLDNEMLCVGKYIYKRSELAQKARQVLWLGLIVFIVFFPLGRSFREIGFIVSALGVVTYYILAYDDSNLKRFGKMIWVYVALLLLIVFKSLHSIDPIRSFYVVESNWFKGFAIFFAGLEIVRSKRDLKILIALFSFMSFYIGLDGVYQYIVGRDFFYGEPLQKLYDGVRLTVCFIRIGDLMSMAMLIAFALPLLLIEKWSIWRAWLVSFLVWSPGMFLFIFAKSRSGYLGFAAGLVFLWILYRGFNWKKVCIPLVLLIAALFFGPRRVSLEQALQDPRIIELWPFAIEVFKQWPMLGVGFNNYNPALTSLGLVFEVEKTFMPHPHNIYLQFLAESGFFGWVILLAFLATYSVWSLTRIFRGLRYGANKGYWSLLSVFAAAYVCYMVTGLGTSVSFFHAWWLGLSLFVLGVTLGGCLVGERLDSMVQSKQPD